MSGKNCHRAFLCPCYKYITPVLNNQILHPGIDQSPADKFGNGTSHRSHPKSCFASPDGRSGIGFNAMIVHERGELLPYAAEIKRAIGIPVIAVGRIDPETAERAIAFET